MILKGDLENLDQLKNLFEDSHGYIESTKESDCERCGHRSFYCKKANCFGMLVMSEENVQRYEKLLMPNIRRSSFDVGTASRTRLTFYDHEIVTPLKLKTFLEQVDKSLLE